MTVIDLAGGSVKHKDLSNPLYIGWLSFLEETETWSADHMYAYQQAMLWETLRRAWGTPGYRALWGTAGIMLDDFRGLGSGALALSDVLGVLPCLTREMLRDDPEAFSVNLPGRYPKTSGGSSGVPIRVYYTPSSFARELASKARLYRRIGWREGDRQLTMRGLEIRTADHTEYVPEFNELRCSSFHLTPSQMEVYFWKAAEFGPLWLRCYPSAGYLFARYLADKGMRLPLAGVLCASEKLYPFQKTLFQEVFGGRVFSHYGNTELAALAGFCEHEDTYHVCPVYGLAELIDENGERVTEPGRVGEIVATSFIAQATPMIRYRTGDLAVYGGERCPACGREGPIWLDIEGRAHEFLITHTGRYISPSALNEHGDLYDCMRQFRYIQQERGKVTFSFVPRHRWFNLSNIAERVCAKLGPDVDLTVEAVDELALTARGKHGFLVQEIGT